MKVLTTADRQALSALCQDIAKERAVAAQLAQGSLLVKQGETVSEDGTRHGGHVQIHPLFNVQSELRRRMTIGFREFGLTPSARTRIQVAPEDRKSASGVLNWEYQDRGMDEKASDKTVQ